MAPNEHEQLRTPKALSYRVLLLPMTIRAQSSWNSGYAHHLSGNVLALCVKNKLCVQVWSWFFLGMCHIHKWYLRENVDSSAHYPDSVWTSLHGFLTLNLFLKNTGSDWIKNRTFQSPTDSLNLSISPLPLMLSAPRAPRHRNRSWSQPRPCWRVRRSSFALRAPWPSTPKTRPPGLC